MLLYTASVFYFYDPAQLFSEKYPKHYIYDNRFFARKVFDTYDFDRVMIGTSMFELSDARELKNGKYINVSISDSKYNERAVMLEYLFKHKDNIKNVALTFDGFGLAHYKNNFRIMYKEHMSLFDKFGIYMNGFVPYQCFITFSKKEKCIGRIHDFYGPVKISKATKGDYKFNEEDFKQGKDFQTKSDFTKDDNFLEQYLLKYIRENPHTTFHMVLPPYSVLMYNQKNLYEEREFLKHYLTIFSKYPNVKFMLLIIAILPIILTIILAIKDIISVF